jgi:hypothetical protein
LELDDASQIEGDGRLEYPTELLEQCRQRDQLANVPAIPRAGVKIAPGNPGVEAGNGVIAADCDDQITADALNRKRKLASGIMVGGEPQQGAAKKAGCIGVPALVPLGQLQPGAAPEVILAAVNAGSATIDNLELMLKLVAGDLMELSKRASAFETETRAAWAAFDTRICSGNTSTIGTRANYAAAVLTPPQPTPPLPVQPSLFAAPPSLPPSSPCPSWTCSPAPLGPGQMQSQAGVSKGHVQGPDDELCFCRDASCRCAIAIERRCLLAKQSVHNAGCDIPFS